MKLIVLIVVSITVFMANCRERPDSREISDDDNNLSDDHNFSDERDLSDGHNLSGGGYLSDGRDLFDDDDLNLPYGSDLSDGPNNETSTTGPVTFTGDPMDLLSSLVDRQLKEDGRVQNEPKLRGGSKCKSNIVCSLLGGSCITNSTYCSGREVPSVCSGAKCKCCINVNLEVKVHDLETEVRAMVVNLTSENSNLNTKLDSMMNFIISANSSQATVNSNMDLKIDSMMATNSNLTIANSNMDLKIDSIMSTSSNLTIANSGMKNELKLIKDDLANANAKQNTKLNSIISLSSNLQRDLTSANTNQNTKLNSIISSSSNLQRDLTSANTNQNTKFNSIISSNSNLRNDLTNANANQDSKLDSIMEHQGCPEGLFLFTPSNQCFRLLTDTRRPWVNAKSACRALGLELAQPYDPIGIQSYFVSKYGLTQSIWIDARGDGSNLRWQRNGRATITTSSPLWWPGHPGNDVSTNRCLLLLAQESQMKANPGLMYYNDLCSNAKWALCELVIE